MEVAPCVQEAGSHAALLLASLNLQRKQAQFCDCVVRQRQNPGQLYPAHRCVLAASSPVFASLLFSTGVLVELQAPCLSDSVLELVLDYIYTGAVPHTCSQQQHYSLLTAACHLQMDELQEALRAQVNVADDTNASTANENRLYKDINNTHKLKTVNIFSKHLPLSDTCSLHSLNREDQYCDDKGAGRSSGKNGANLTPQGIIQNIPCTSEVNRVSREDKEVQRDQFQAGIRKSDSWQMSTEEERVRRVENRRSLNLFCAAEVQEEETGRVEKRQRLCFSVKSQAEKKQIDGKEEDKSFHSPLHLLNSQLKDCVSPSTPHLCLGAVPVIRHSSTAVMAESTVPPYHPVYQVSVGSSRAPDTPPGSTENDRNVEGITTKHRNHNGAQNQDCRNNKDRNKVQSWDNKVSADQCALQNLCSKSNVDQSDILKQEHNCSKTDNDEIMGNKLSPITADNDHDAHCYSFNKNHTNHLGDASDAQNKDRNSFIRGLKNETDLSVDDFSSDHQRLHCSDCQGPRAVGPLPVQDTDTGSDSHCEDLCPEGEVKEERCYSSGCQAQMDRKDNHCVLYGPESGWYPNIHGVEIKTKDAASCYQEQDDKDTAMDKGTNGTFLEREHILATEMSEPHLPVTMPTANNLSDLTYSVVGPSYSGHLHYHCLPQKDTLLSSRHSSSKQPNTSHPNHSDLSSDEEEVSASASQHFATPDEVLLLDISTKPAELLVSYRHRSEKDTFGNWHQDNDREPGNNATSAGVDKRKIRVRTKFGAESEPWVGETNVEDRESFLREQSRPGDKVLHRAGFMDDDSANAAFAVCSSQSVPDCVQAPVPSTLSACIPSTLSASMPTNISAPLSTTVQHPFQCSLCDRSFSQRGSLNRHVRSHLGVRPFPCPRCPMTFSRQYRVTEHMRVHQRLGSDFQKPPASSV